MSYSDIKEKKYKIVHCPGGFQFIIKSVQEGKYILHFLYMEFNICRRKQHNIIKYKTIITE